MKDRKQKQREKKKKEEEGRKKRTHTHEGTHERRQTETLQLHTMSLPRQRETGKAHFTGRVQLAGQESVCEDDYVYRCKLYHLVGIKNKTLNMSTRDS